MDNEICDLSPVIELNEVEFKDTCAELGWSVYTQEGETVTPLVYDGSGCFEGLAELGQTFYLSRVMQGELDEPISQLDTATRNFSVFPDGMLIYTDCSEQDNRIGCLTLFHARAGPLGKRHLLPSRRICGQHADHCPVHTALRRDVPHGHPRQPYLASSYSAPTPVRSP